MIIYAFQMPANCLHGQLPLARFVFHFRLIFATYQQTQSIPLFFYRDPLK